MAGQRGDKTDEANVARRERGGGAQIGGKVEGKGGGRRGKRDGKELDRAGGGRASKHSAPIQSAEERRRGCIPTVSRGSALLHTFLSTLAGTKSRLHLQLAWHSLHSSTSSSRDLMMPIGKSHSRGNCQQSKRNTSQANWLDYTIYADLLQVCAKIGSLQKGRKTHAHIVETGFAQNMYLGNNLINMYGKCRSLECARLVFDKMSKRNIVSWNTMIAGYAQNGFGEEALELFRQMQLKGEKPNHLTFASVVKACASIAALEQGKNVHDQIMETVFETNVVVGTALVDMYAKCGSLESAREVFDKIIEKNVVSWNSMIAGYAQNGYTDGALKLFFQMPNPDVIAWTALIASFVQNGRSEDALKLFYQMQKASMKPDQFAFASMLNACGNLVALEEGKQAHSYIIRTGLNSDVALENALVDMYAKCGVIEDASQVFDKMPRRNLFSWTAMIAGSALHGRGKEALKLFEEMVQKGMKPDEITFVGVLSACSHAGLVDEGHIYFESMSGKHGITPTVEHYTCMVDLLGRAGSLAEAESFISQMPINPNAAVWGAFLGACRIHDDLLLGKHAAEHLFEFHLQDAGTYVLISNMYAAAGKWDDVARVRKLMKERGIQKQPGCSWIEVNNMRHAFVVEDRLHPQKDEIYTNLDT
eukprot:Gb_35258 [translate_table: standard]